MIFSPHILHLALFSITTYKKIYWLKNRPDADFPR
jgi:hypothetical protein